MATASGLMKHNPAFLSAGELQRAFIVRDAERQILLQVIRENTGPVNQHVLLIAPRGMGKTMLARRIALDIAGTEDLARAWKPVVLSEECYDIASAGDLWVRVLGEAGRVAGAIPNRWADAYDRLRRERDPVSLREQALARLRELAEEADRRLLVVVENLNLVFTEQANEDTGWEVRDTLLNDPRIMLLATATTRFDEIDRPGRALYDLFRVIRLEPLDTADCQALWMAVSGEDLSPQRIRPLQILTGGNPRLLAILAGFSTGRSFREITQSFAALIDDYTTYFKANIESLPAQERRVFVTLADLWDPAEAREVAALARMEVNKTSAYLKRLVDRGAVTAERAGRRAIYQVAERLLNLYWLMRQSSATSERARAVVEFMARFYGSEQTVRRITAEACDLPAAEREYHNVAVRYLFSRGGTEMIVRDRLVAAVDERYMALPEAADLLATEPVGKGEPYSEAVAGYVKSAHARLLAAIETFGAGKTSEALKQLEDLIDDLGSAQEAPLASQLARALAARGVVLRDLDRFEEEIAAYDEVVERFGEREEVPLAKWVAMALVTKGVRLGDLDRFEEEIAVYDEVVERFGEREEVPLAEWVARALTIKGAILSVLDRFEGAIVVCDEVVERFGEREEVPLAERVAAALLIKGVTLGVLHRPVEAIAAYDELIGRFEHREEVLLADVVSGALVEKGMRLARLRRLDESIRCVQEALHKESLPERYERTLVSLLVVLAAKGLGSELLRAVASSPVAMRLEPLVVALRIHQGQDVRAPHEVMEVAKDLLKRIEAAGDVGDHEKAPARVDESS